MNRSLLLPQLHCLVSARSCGYERVQRPVAAQRGTSCHQAHLKDERHGSDLPVRLFPAETPFHSVQDPETKLECGTFQFSARRKKPSSVQNRTGKPLPRLTAPLIPLLRHRPGQGHLHTLLLQPPVVKLTETWSFPSTPHQEKASAQHQ